MMRLIVTLNRFHSRIHHLQPIRHGIPNRCSTYRGTSSARSSKWVLLVIEKRYLKFCLSGLQVSLLWNAVLSRLLLRESFSFRTLAGTCLIATGASLIAIFGVVPEENHTLEELMDLFRRSGFVIYITLMSVAVVAVLAIVSRGSSAISC